ncbi:MAG: hypothetical protein KGH60_04235 [Candidatus Micrarchaeota archaeon]|nr:hypothetical protein [Candidatus Micrarchaeota archaeon]
MMMGLDQLIGLAVLAVALPGAVLTMNQGAVPGQYASFGNHLISDMKLQSALSGIIAINSLKINYTLAIFAPNAAISANYPTISRIAVINGQAYMVTVQGNEGANVS